MKKIPLRMCLGCREMKPKKDLLRVVRTPEGTVELDEKGKKSGRGAYLCRNAACMARAVKQKQLERVLEVSISKELNERLQEEMAKLQAVNRSE